MAEPGCSRFRTIIRRGFTKIKSKKKTKTGSEEKDSEQRPRTGKKSSAIPLTNPSTALYTKATTTSAPAADPKTTLAQDVAENISRTTCEVPRTTGSTEDHDESIQGTGVSLNAIADTKNTMMSGIKVDESFSKRMEGNDPGAQAGSAGHEETSTDTRAGKDGNEAALELKSHSGDDIPWYSERTPEWNQAVNKWRTTHEQDFDELKARITGVDKIDPIRTAGDWLARLKPADSTGKQTAARIKRWQPVLNSVRGIAMTASAFDPHKIAPIVCASILGGLDVLFNVMNPEDRDKILDVVCQCGNTIEEGNTFEMFFYNMSHPAVKRKMPKMRELLEKQYLTALTLACEVRKRCEDMQIDFVSFEESKTSVPQNKRFWGWFERRGRLLWHKMSNEVLEWEGGLKELARLKSEWAVKKDDLKDSIALDDHTVKVRAWLRKQDYPNPSPSDIRARVIPDDLYTNGADWFLQGDAFQAFCAGFTPADTKIESDVEMITAEDPEGDSKNTTLDPVAVKRILWLRGGLGVGKTTVLYLAFADLSTFGGPTLDSQNAVSIVPYFCDASGSGSNHPDCETIIRSMIRRMALLPDGSLAKAAGDFYLEQQSSTATDGTLTLEEHWYPLFRDLLTSSGSGRHLVFLVDALDECNKPADWEKLLKFMSNTMHSHSNMSFLCSSHAHVTVDRFFLNEPQDSSMLVVEDVSTRRTHNSFNAYIDGEIERREADARGSIFYDPDHIDLLEELRGILLRNGRGVFQWVRIWLNILLAVEDTDRMSITSAYDARRWLDRLKNDSRESSTEDDLLTTGYQRLWDITCDRGRDDFEQRARLFHFVLAAEVPATLQMLSAALRIRKNTFERSPQPEVVMRLCSNFLVLNAETGELEFAHNSARNYISNLDMHQAKLVAKDEENFFSDRRNHESVARLYMDLVGSAAHP